MSYLGCGLRPLCLALTRRLPPSRGRAVASVAQTSVVTPPAQTVGAQPVASGASNFIVAGGAQPGSAAKVPVGTTSPPVVPPLEERVGFLGDAAFEQHWSVASWRSFQWPPPGVELDSVNGMRAVAAAVVQNAREAGFLADAQSATYWAYHVARCAFFSAQGAAAVLLHAAASGSLLQGRTGNGAKSVPLSKFLLSSAVNLPGEAMGAFQQDLRLIKEGAYKLPWDMTTPRHQQYSPLWVARRSAAFLREASRVLTARRDQAVGGLWLNSSPFFPDYYRNNFHFQSDGWFSTDSARVYDAATETLFVGRQDAMQRTTLVPIMRHLRDHPSPSGCPAILEVGAGTGRFATFVRDNVPAAHLTVCDLSPFYLHEAHAAMQHWEATAAAHAPSLGGSAAFALAAAEALPLDDNSQDVVYSVYTFHEMPTHARDAAIAEMARVLKPGGLLVITDSMQWGDRATKDDNIGAFVNFNEPHYGSYINYDFSAAFRAAGLEPGMKLLQSASKTVSAVKPLNK